MQCLLFLSKGRSPISVSNQLKNWPSHVSPLKNSNILSTDSYDSQTHWLRDDLSSQAFWNKGTDCIEVSSSVIKHLSLDILRTVTAFFVHQEEYFGLH